MPIREIPIRQGPPGPAPPPREHKAPVNMTPVQSLEPYPAEKARGGEIILRQPWQRWVFIGGLVGIFVLLVVLRLIVQHA